MTVPKQATCPSCGAEIMWADTERGKRMPLDVTPRKRIVLEHGLAMMTDIYELHFATCPNVDGYWRSVKPGGRGLPAEDQLDWRPWAEDDASFADPGYDGDPNWHIREFTPADGPGARR